MKARERNDLIKDNLEKMYNTAAGEEIVATPVEEELNNIVSSKVHSFREVLLCVIVQMMINSKLRATENWEAFNARGIYDNGPVKEFLINKGIPRGKSGPLNISKGTEALNEAWVAGRRKGPTKDVATQVVLVLRYLENNNLFDKVEAVGISLIKKMLDDAERIKHLSVDIPASKDPDRLIDLCNRLITNVPDEGNTPQQIVAKLLKCYHSSIHSSIDVTGGEDRASVTSTTSNKPGDITEECCGRILKVYEITIKPFDEGRIVDSYDCIEKYKQHSEQQIHGVIVICRPEDCPEHIQKSGFELYIGSVEHQDVKYYFWNIFEWIASMLQRMPDDGKELFSVALNGYINDINTSEAVKVEWRKILGIE